MTTCKKGYFIMSDNSTTITTIEGVKEDVTEIVLNLKVHPNHRRPF